MYLSDIELVGFKSFATKTKLEFSSGLSAIVGPNGCGKSNIVDAMRWVLGEKKASALRSEQMDNLIFNGSKKRKPTSMAEVTLTIDNNKKILPSEYDQITVTRRLFRNGDSEFLMNKTKCRLKDIHNLFMDTGIGPDSYSVIELGMVEAILSGRVDDRRRLFEEAAGIKKYKQHRKEAQSRLNAVRTDLERLGDIVEEVRKNVASLQRQAAKTRRYNTMQSELEQIELLLFAHEYKLLKEKLEKATAQFNQIRSEKEGLDRRLQEYSENLQEQREELAIVESEFEKASAEEKELIDKMADCKKTIAVTEEKIANATGAEERLTNEIKFAEETKLNIEKDGKSAEDRLADLEKDILLSDEVVADAKNQRDQSAVESQKLSDEVQKSKSEILNLKHKLSTNEDSVRHLEARASGVENTLKKLAEQSKEYNAKLAQIEERKIELDRDGGNLDLQLAEQNTELSRAIEEKKNLTAEISHKKEKIENLQTELSARRASLVFLEGIQAGGESVKFLAKNNKWQKKHLLEEIIDIDDNYKTALHAALGDAATAFLIDNTDEAFEAIKILQDSQKGKAGFIIPTSSKATDNAKKLNNPSYKYALDLVKIDDTKRSLLESILAGTYFVSKKEEALKAIRDGAFKAITEEGEIFLKSGLIYGGSKNKSEGIAVGRKVKIQNLNKEISKLEQAIEDTNNAVAEAKEAIEMLEIPILEQTIRETERLIQKLQADLSRLEMDKEAIERNADMNEDNVNSYERDLEKINIEKKERQTEIENLLPAIAENEKSAEELAQKLKEAEEKLAFTEEQLRSAEISKFQMQSDINQLKQSIDRSKNEISKISNENEKKTIEIENASALRKSLREQLALTYKDLDDSTIRLGDVQSKKETAKEEKTIVNEQMEHNRMSIGALRKDIDRKNTSIHQIDLNLKEVNVNIEHLTNRALEGYQVEIDSYETELSEEFSIEDATEEVNELKRKLSKLGNINFQALEEYEVQKERLEFSETQMNDLIESETILKDTIFELNTKAETAFRKTYDEIQRNFKMLFNKLFGGEGEASLRLISDDLLESDIEITARPPGKKPHSIDMLSGGEKTLTAIALLFAIYLVKPSPFCILDEVDAPLDDKNLDKYLDMIKDFSKDTQFLLVTHNKKTMSAASKLYGITMQEQGVSKVVSVNVETGA